VRYIVMATRGNIMNDLKTIGDRYVNVWNETDAEKRRKAIADLWVPDGVHYVKTREARGYDALEQRIIGSHNKNVKEGGNRFRAVKDLEVVQSAIKFTWEMVASDGEKVLAVGLEFLMVDDDGRITSDYQFIIS
jgi:hypothetical protein